MKGLIGHLLGKNFWKNVLLTGGGFSVLVYKLVKKNPENVLLTHCPINPFKTVYRYDYHVRVQVEYLPMKTIGYLFFSSKSFLNSLLPKQDPICNHSFSLCSSTSIFKTVYYIPSEYLK